jgi:hypothetical protein
MENFVYGNIAKIRGKLRKTDLDARRLEAIEHSKRSAKLQRNDSDFEMLFLAAVRGVALEF